MPDELVLRGVAGAVLVVGEAPERDEVGGVLHIDSVGEVPELGVADVEVVIITPVIARVLGAVSVLMVLHSLRPEEAIVFD